MKEHKYVFGFGGLGSFGQITVPIKKDEKISEDGVRKIHKRKRTNGF